MTRPTPHATILRVGDEIRWNGDALTVAALTAQQVRLVDAAGAPTFARLPELLAGQALEALSSTPNAPLRGLDGLPAEVVEAARWWERHIVEVLTGLPPDPAPGQRPKPEYDAGLRSLRQRELAKVEELTLAGHRIGWSTLKRRRLDYERDGIWGLVDQRATRERSPAGRIDARVVDAVARAIAEETDRSTGTVARLRRRTGRLLVDEHGPGVVALPAQRTFYRLVARLSQAKHTFGSARTRRSLAKQPEGPFSTLVAARPGELMQIDSTPLDVRVVLGDGQIDRVEMTGLVDLATRSIAALVLAPSTKSVDAALLLARALTPAPAGVMRCGCLGRCCRIAASPTSTNGWPGLRRGR